MNLLPGFILLIVAGLVSPPAHAYLDPSTGSMVVTAIVGLFASIALAVKTYWYKLRAFFRGDRKREDGRHDATSGVSAEPQEPTD